jgi:nonsense-mediated mRNA decay protein 3
MFCVECGKEGEIYKDGLCVQCYLKNHKFTSGPRLIDIGYCFHCNSFKYKNSWFLEPFEEVLKKWILHYFQISRELKNIKIEPKCRESSDGIHCLIVINGMLDGHQISEEHEVIIYLKKSVCDVCSKRFGGYHEAIIQVRANNRTLSKSELLEIQTNVENEVKSMYNRGNRSLFITDIGIERGGIDFFLSDKSAALSIVKKLQKQYGGELKTSSRNVGMKDSRQVYRMTYLLRLPHYQRDDFISYGGKYYFLISSFPPKTLISSVFFISNIFSSRVDSCITCNLFDEIEVKK